MKDEKIKVLALLPMELPKEIELDNTLEAMQKFVDGNIECLTFYDSGSEVILVCNDEGMIEAFDSANQLVKDEVLALPEE